MCLVYCIAIEKEKLEYLFVYSYTMHCLSNVIHYFFSPFKLLLKKKLL